MHHFELRQVRLSETGEHYNVDIVNVLTDTTISITIPRHGIHADPLNVDRAAEIGEDLANALRHTLHSPEPEADAGYSAGT
jgi:hypothetical protein